MLSNVMALEQIHDSVRTLIYGAGMGEKPPIRLAAANASESTASPPLVSFSIATGQGTKIHPSDTLAKYAPDDADEAFVIYVTSIASDSITGVNGGMIGAPKVAADGDLDSAVLEQNPLATSHEIHQAIETIFDLYLYPDVYKISQLEIAAPDLIDGQESVAATVTEIVAAWQIIGPTTYSVPFTRYPKEVDTDISSTGLLAEFDWIDGSKGFYTAKSKLTTSDDIGDITRIVSTGAAALLLGGAAVEATIENTKKDNSDAVAQRNQVGGLLWRDFLTLKQEYARNLGRRINNQITVDRG